MAFIWRIEDKEGVGMYTKCGVTLDWKFLENISNRKRYNPQYDPHPSANEDLGLWEFWIELRDSENWYFGYDTLAQTRDWVGSLEMCKYMAKEGLRLVKYHMDREAYQAGEFQVIFKKKYSLKTETRKLSTLFS